MQRIIYFLIRNKDFILFLSLFTISLSININYNEYNKSKFLNSSNSLFSSLYDTKLTISKYFNLEYQNQLLAEENRNLRFLIYNYKNEQIEESDLDKINLESNYRDGNISELLIKYFENLLLKSKNGKAIFITSGATIVTGGNSLIFPKGILIGYVDSFKLDNSENYLELEINLATDMTNIENLYILKNNNIKEINSLDE